MPLPAPTSPPCGDVYKRQILTGVPEEFVVSSKTQYPDECIEFLKWFLGPEVGREQAQTIGWFNASKNVTEGVNDTKLLDGYKVVRCV